MDLMSEMFTTPFMQRALIGSLMLAVMLGLFGVFMVPRKLGFMADGVSHASLLGIAVGIMFGGAPLLWAALVAACIGMVLAKIEDNSRLTLDSVVGIVLVGGMSSAVILMSLTPGYKPELVTYLFGSLLSISWNDIYFLIGFFAVTLILFKMQWRTLVLTTVHGELSSVLGLRTSAAKYFLFVGTSIALIAGVKLLGVILISALLIIPFSAANQATRSLRSSLIVTECIAIGGTIAGIICSYVYDLPTGPAIALVFVALFLLCVIAGKIISRPLLAHEHTQ
tara:strand:- start:1639 stop:2481 length:843 start_codon:yes stop_codon:yes gene_type:complete